MKEFVSRRRFLGASAIAAATLTLPKSVLAAKKKSLLVFTKSSGFEHTVVKEIDGRPSIVDVAVKTLGEEHGFEVTTSKDGQIFDSKEFKNHAALLFFTTGDLTTQGTDKNPPMSPEGKTGIAGCRVWRTRFCRSPRCQRHLSYQA